MALQLTLVILGGHWLLFSFQQYSVTKLLPDFDILFLNYRHNGEFTEFYCQIWYDSYEQ